MVLVLLIRIYLLGLPVRIARAPDSLLLSFDPISESLKARPQLSLILSFPSSFLLLPLPNLIPFVTRPDVFPDLRCVLGCMRERITPVGFASVVIRLFALRFWDCHSHNAAFGSASVQDDMA